MPSKHSAVAALRKLEAERMAIEERRRALEEQAALELGRIILGTGVEAFSRKGLVRSDPLGDIGCLCRLNDDPVELAGADRHRRVLTWEEPAIGMKHTLLPPRAPPLPQQHKQTFGQHGVAIASTLAAFDPEQHALAVDIAHLERRDLADPQPRTVGVNRQSSCLSIVVSA